MARELFILKTTKASNNIKVYSDSISNEVVATIKGGGESYTIYDTPLGSNRYKINIPDSSGNTTEEYGYVDRGYFSSYPSKYADKSDKVQNVENKTIEEGENETEEYTDQEVENYLEDAISDTIDVFNLETMTGIYGAPYQFMESVDRSLNGTKLGRKYTEKIVTRMPLLFLSPGTINFMPSYKKNQKSGVINYLVSGSDDSSVLTDILNGKNGRYYTFEYAYADYFKYVNTMLRAGAIYLGIGDVKVDFDGNEDKELSKVDWSNAGNKKISTNKFATGKEYVTFYLDSSTSISETFSNETTQSQLFGTINGMSDVAREIQFLLGGAAGVEFDMMKNDEQINNTLDTIDSIADKYIGGSSLLRNIGESMATICSGGKLLFPEIWSDSSFSKSYSLSFKLRTPDGDKLSWFFNIYVPLAHLVCMTAPLQSSISVNGYKSPFLVRASYKGLLNCSLGMITSLNITKGKDKAWTIDGLPTEVDIDLEIKDLYNLLSISCGDTLENSQMAAQNTCYMDYIANTCGVNINLPDVQRSLAMYKMLFTNTITDIPNNIWNQTQQKFSNTLKKMYETFLGM